MRFFNSKHDKTAKDQAEVVKSAVAGINDMVRQINELVDAKKDGDNGTRSTTG